MMLSRPFWEHDALFFLHVTSANDGKLDSLARHVAFARLAHDMFGWFLQHSALASVKLTSVALAEFEDDRRAVRIRHHFKLTSIGHELCLPERYFSDNLPWKMIGNGVFSLERSDAAVQSLFAFLALDADAQVPLNYRTMVHVLALRIDAAFTDVMIQHDLGLAPSWG